MAQLVAATLCYPKRKPLQLLTDICETSFLFWMDGNVLYTLGPLHPQITFQYVLVALMHMISDSSFPPPVEELIGRLDEEAFPGPPEQRIKADDATLHLLLARRPLEKDVGWFHKHVPYQP